MRLFEKPAEGAPCNGCGWCCISEPCLISKEKLGATDKCPALEVAGDRYACGLITNPGLYLGTPSFGDPILSQLFGEALGVGKGCDSSLSPNHARLQNEGE